MYSIDVSGLDRTKLIQAMYEAAREGLSGLDKIYADDKSTDAAVAKSMIKGLVPAMSVAAAAGYAKKGDLDYVGSMKFGCFFKGDVLYPGVFNREHGAGLIEEVVARARVLTQAQAQVQAM